MNDLTPEQQRAATYPGSVVVRAGAGSGKTRVLAERAVWLMEAGLRPRELVAVTFTEAAALELRGRIAQTLEARNQVWSKGALARLGEARIGTLHSLCATILREHPVESGVGPGFEIETAPGTERDLPNLDQALVQALKGEILPPWCHARTVRAWVEVLLSNEHTAEAAFVSQEQGGLAAQWKQLEAGLEGLGEVRGAINGVFKILNASGATDPQDPLEKARQAVIEVYARFGVTAGTGFEEDFDLLEWRSQITLILDGVRANAGRAGAWPQGKAPTLDALQRLRKLGDKEANLLGFERGSLEILPLLARIYGRVSHDLRTQRLTAGRVTFDDLERLALGALSQPQVRAFYHTRLRAVLLDEAQDTSPIQAELVRLLTGPQTTLTAVGDAQQSIYGFRRAAPELFTDLGRALGEVQLSGSFRALPALTEALGTYFLKRLSPGAVPFLPQQAYRNGDARQEALEWQIFERPTVALAREAEARHLAGRIQALHQEGYALSEMAILLRSRGDLAVYTRALRSAGLAYSLLGAAGGVDRPEIGDALALLHLLANPSDDLALVTVLRSPFASLSDGALYRLARSRAKGEALSDALERSPEQLVWLSTLLERRAHLLPARALKEGLERSGYLDALRFLPEGARSMANLQALVGWLRAQSDLPTAWDLVRRLEQIGLPLLSEALLGGEQAVTVSTVHGAKGLEYPVVFVPDLTRTLRKDTPSLLFNATQGVSVRRGENKNPSLYIRLEEEAQEREQLERERLEYVAFTRARDHLILSAAVTPKSRWAAERLEEALPLDGVLRSSSSSAVFISNEVLL